MKKSTLANNIIKEKVSKINELDKLLDVIGAEIEKYEIVDAYYFSLFDLDKKYLITDKKKFKEDFKGLDELTQKMSYKVVDNDIYEECLSKNKLLIINKNEIKNYNEFMQNNYKYWRIKSAAFIPLSKNKEKLGLVCLISHYSEIKRENIENILKLFEELFPYIRNNLEHTRQIEKQKEILNSFERNQKVFEISERIITLKSIHDIYEIILDEIFNIFNFDIGMILYKEDNYLRHGYSKAANRKYKHIIKELEDFTKEADITIRPPNSAASICCLQNIHFYIEDYDKMKNVPLAPLDQKTVEIAGSLRTNMIFSIHYKKLPIGVIILSSLEKPSKMTENDIKLLRSLGSFIGIAIQNAQLFSLVEEQKKKITETKNDLEAINEISKEISISLDFKSVYNKIVNYLNDTYGFEGNILNLVTQNKKKYIIETAKTPDYLKDAQNELIGNEYPLSKNEGGRTAQCILDNQHFFFTDITQEMIKKLKNSINKKIAQKLEIKTILHLPIAVSDEVIGSFSLMAHTKPIHLGQEDIESIQRFSSQIAIILRNSKLYDQLMKKTSELESKNKTISDDLMLAKKIQTNVISEEYKKIRRLKIKVLFNPMIEVGGDIYDIFELNEKYYRIFIADATGHGVQAALTTMIIKTEYDKIKEIDGLPNIVLSIFNNVFFKKYFNLGVFFTCLIVDVDLNNNMILYSSAGHPDQFILNSLEVSNLKAGGKMVGLLKNTQFEIRKSTFLKGDKLFLFTDGIFEEFNAKDEQFGIERLKTIIKENKNSTISNIISKIKNTEEKWRDGKKVNDDITLIGIEYK